MVAMRLAARWLASIWDNSRSLEVASALSTFILIAGAVIEDWSKLKQIGILTAKWLMFRCNAFERCALKKLIFHSIGALLVVVGIAGELVFETRTFIVDDAASSAASIEIGQLKVRADELENGNLALRKQAGDAEERAANAEVQAAKLLADIQPRRLSPNQEKEIADALKPYAGKVVGIATYQQDAEAMILGIQIANTLTKAKIIVWDRLGTFTATGTPLYVGVTIDAKGPNKELASVLSKALSKKGKLLAPIGTVSFGQGSTMYVPPFPKAVQGASLTEDAFIFIGEKPIAEETWQQSSSKPSAKP